MNWIDQISPSPEHTFSKGYLKSLLSTVEHWIPINKDRDPAMVTRRKHKAQNLASRELRERHHQMANNLVDVGHNGSVDSNEPATELIEKTLDPSTRQALDYVLPKVRIPLPARESWIQKPNSSGIVQSQSIARVWSPVGYAFPKEHCKWNFIIFTLNLTTESAHTLCDLF